MRKVERQKSKDESRQAARQEDWVVFQLKPTAPDYVATGHTRFAGAYRRGAEPFKCTRGEWNVYLEKMGFFEEVSKDTAPAAVASGAQTAEARSPQRTAES